jgi:hypothetical protein
MSSISILIDLDHLVPAHGSLVCVEQVSEYPTTYLALQEAVHTERAYSVCVRHHAIAVWLTRMANLYGEQVITIKHYTLRDALSAQWQVDIPDQVTNEELQEAHLYALPVITRHGQTFWDILLAHFYGDLFTSQTFPRGSLSLLLNKIRERASLEGVNSPLIAKALAMRFAQWKRLASRPGERSLIVFLQSDAEELRHAFAQYKLLCNYPLSLGEQVLGETGELFRQIREETDSLILYPEDKASVLPIIESYLRAQCTKITSSEDAGLLIAQMSGSLLEEFDCLESLLKDHPEWLTPALLHRLEQRFQVLHQTLTRRLARLSRLIVPAFPPRPDMQWQAPAWLRWVQDAYMPYYTWGIDTQEEPDEQLAKYAWQFADWYYAHFLRVRCSYPEFFAFNALYRERDSIGAEKAVSLILLLDNLNFALVDDLVSIFRLHHFSLQNNEVKPLFSLIPTTTEVSKPGILSGKGDQRLIESSRYLELIVNEWSSVFQGKRIAYLPNITALTDLRERSSDVYFLNYLALDRLLHEDTLISGQTHREMAYDRFASLANAIHIFVQQFQLEQDIHLYVVSDHGSTHIPCQRGSLLPREWVKRWTDTPHVRYLALSDDDFAALPAITETQCYCISRQRFETPQNYLVARDYDHFIETKDSYYVHGGLTPEEVVVPFAHFVYQKGTCLPPSIRLRTKQFRYQVRSTLHLVVGNPNAFELRDLHLMLLDAEAEELLIERLSPKHEQPLDLPVLFRKTPGCAERRSLTMRLCYVCQGEMYGPLDISCSITVKSMMEVPDDAFDF